MSIVWTICQQRCQLHWGTYGRK